MTNHLEALAKRAEDDPFFLGCALKDYAQSEGLGDAALAQALGCSIETLNLLRLCRMPHDDHFRDDINRIVARFEVNRDALAQAARRGQVLIQVRGLAPRDQGMFLAARDLEEKSDPEPEGNGG